MIGNGKGRSAAAEAAPRAPPATPAELWARWSRLVLRLVRLLELEFLAQLGGSLTKFWGLYGRQRLLRLRRGN